MQYEGPPVAESRRLARSTRDKMFSGVAGGMADYFELDPVVVRLIWVGAAIVTGGLAIPVYLVMWMVMPRDDRLPAVPLEPSYPAEPSAYATTATDDAAGAASATGDPIGGPALSAPIRYGRARPDDPERRRARQRTAGIILIALGVLFLAGQSGLFWWIQWRYMWPLILIAIGVGILLRQGNWRR